ncbi:MAG: GNAT family N-acetyltransferase [Oscillospiraceae bacterium]|nr:GNAT family N-acetyltransferase [Oscillospiraceae bacterium]
MDYSFVIRKAVLEDAADIHGILVSSFDAYRAAADISGPLEAVEESISHIEHDIVHKDVFIALMDKVPVGTVRVSQIDSETALLSRLGVVPRHQNIGIGKSLLNLVDKVAMEKKYKRIHLYTATKNSSLMRFYYGRGFYVDSTSKNRGYVRALLVKEYIIS